MGPKCRDLTNLFWTTFHFFVTSSQKQNFFKLQLPIYYLQFVTTEDTEEVESQSLNDLDTKDTQDQNNFDTPSQDTLDTPSSLPVLGKNAERVSFFV